MKEKPTAQECEQLRKEVKESKVEFLRKFDFYLYPLTLLIMNYFNSDMSKEVKWYSILSIILVTWAVREITNSLNKIK